MEPALRDGALVVAQPLHPTTSLRVGDVVVARRPDRPEVEMIKRITAFATDGALILAGDNPAASTDSRHFGPVPRGLVLARVRWRYWPLPPVRL